ncbi:MAG: hypothetical protein M1817_004840 [Caeruleum heppii]|nr:MAG: hypothetical protein M1817_004840 [Caeruleum heppii]
MSFGQTRLLNAQAVVTAATMIVGPGTSRAGDQSPDQSSLPSDDSSVPPSEGIGDADNGTVGGDDGSKVSHKAESLAQVNLPDSAVPFANLKAQRETNFEIATEETEKKSVYAREDRAAAREELAKLKEAFTDATQSSETDVSTEIKGRVGQRIRELEGAIEELNKADFED